MENKKGLQAKNESYTKDRKSRFFAAGVLYNTQAQGPGILSKDTSSLLPPPETCT